MMSENGRHTVCLFLSGLFLVAAFVGCKKEAEPAPTEPEEQEQTSAPVTQPAVETQPRVESLPVDTAGSSRLAEAITLFQQGQQNEAVEAFVNIQWKGRVGFPESSPLALTEAEFAQLPASERNERLAEIMGELIVLRSLTKAVLAKGQSGPDGAKYTNAAATFGKLLAEDKEALAILKMLGESLQEKAAEQSS
jgi:hypothetical protein